MPQSSLNLANIEGLNQETLNLILEGEFMEIFTKRNASLNQTQLHNKLKGYISHTNEFLQKKLHINEQKKKEINKILSGDINDFIHFYSSLNENTDESIKILSIGIFRILNLINQIEKHDKEFKTLESFNNTLIRVFKILDKLNTLTYRQAIHLGGMPLADSMALSIKNTDSYFVRKSYFIFQRDGYPLIIHNQNNEGFIYLTNIFSRLKDTESRILSILDNGTNAADLFGIRIIGKSIDDVLKIYNLFEKEFQFLQVNMSNKKKTLIDPTKDNETIWKRIKSIKKLEQWFYNDCQTKDELQEAISDFNHIKRKVFELKASIYLHESIIVDQGTSQNAHSSRAIKVKKQKMTSLKKELRKGIQNFRKTFLFYPENSNDISYKDMFIFKEDGERIKSVNSKIVRPFLQQFFEFLLDENNGQLHFADIDGNKHSSKLYLGINIKVKNQDNLPMEFGFNTEIFEFLNEMIAPHKFYKKRRAATIRKKNHF